MEAILFLSSLSGLPSKEWPQGSAAGVPSQQAQVWPLAMKAVLLQRSLWHVLKGCGTPASWEDFLSDDALRLAVSLAEDAHASLRDEAWQDRQIQQQSAISRYLNRVQLALPSFSDENLMREVFADALVLAAWLVDVDFFAPSRTQAERALQLEESVLAVAQRGVGP